MYITIKSKLFGTQTINAETFDVFKASKESTIWKVIEYMFNNWYDAATVPGRALSKDVAGCYNGYTDQPAIYSKCGAIRQGIETFLEICAEDGLTHVTTAEINKMDIECAFDI